MIETFKNLLGRYNRRMQRICNSEPSINLNWLDNHCQILKQRYLQIFDNTMRFDNQYFEHYRQKLEANLDKDFQRFRQARCQKKFILVESKDLHFRNRRNFIYGCLSCVLIATIFTTFSFTTSFVLGTLLVYFIVKRCLWFFKFPTFLTTKHFHFQFYFTQK